MMRRAVLPFRSSSGFHPMPRLALASALGLGVVGREEVAELELEEELAPAEVHRRLAENAPAGLQILSVRPIDRRQTAQACRTSYFLPLSVADHPELPARIAALVTQNECWVERQRPHRRSINIRPYVRALTLTAEGLSMEFAVTPQGTARPDEVLDLLGLADLFKSGAVLERTGLEILDEHNGQLSEEINEKRNAD
jgi:radical SAM-linked protein